MYVAHPTQLHMQAAQSQITSYNWLWQTLLCVQLQEQVEDHQTGGRKTNIGGGGSRKKRKRKTNVFLGPHGCTVLPMVVYGTMVRRTGRSCAGRPTTTGFVACKTRTIKICFDDFSERSRMEGQTKKTLVKSRVKPSLVFPVGLVRKTMIYAYLDVKYGLGPMLSSVENHAQPCSWRSRHMCTCKCGEPSLDPAGRPMSQVRQRADFIKDHEAIGFECEGLVSAR